MAFAATDLPAIRAHIGTTAPPSDQDLAQSFARLGSVEAVALEVVRGRLADMLARPAELSVDGDYSEKWTRTIELLTAKEAELAAVVARADGSGGVVQVARLTRSGRSR